jgi:hypothetical protein
LTAGVPAEGNHAGTTLRRPEARKGNYSLELPISKQFSPKQIPSLLEFLQIVRDRGPETGGSSADAREAIKERFFSEERRGGTDAKRLTSAGNAISSARYWDLLDDSDTLTAVGRTVLDAADDNEAVLIMVKHFLRHLGGAQITTAILGVIRAHDGTAPRKDALATALHEAGIYENRDGTDHAAVLAWLAHPGARVVEHRGRNRWSLNEERFVELAGIEPNDVEAVARRDPVQLAVLVELARTPGGRSDSGSMQRVLAVRADLEVQASGFRRRYLDPLAKDGLIEIKGRAAGRGATPFRITDLGKREAITDLVSRFDRDGTPQYQPSDLLRPTSEIVADLDRKSQPDPNRRGVALEHLALRIVSWLGLSNVRWRERRDRAEEIDGTAEAMVPSFALWQIQAKNTAQLSAEDAAKEVGLAVANGAAVVMLITTGTLTSPAVSVIDRVERRSGLAVICLDGQDVCDIVDDPGRLAEKLRREALRARSRRDR